MTSYGVYISQLIRFARVCNHVADFNARNKCLSEPVLYGDLVYKCKKLIGRNDFSFQFRKIISRYKRIGYKLNVMRQSACLVDNYAAFFNCTPVGRASDSMIAPT